MPCRTDHYEPNERETELNKAAKCYVWIVGILNEREDQPKREITSGMEKASKSEWGTGCGDTVAELCALLHDIGDDLVKNIVGDNFHDHMAAELMSWNMRHKAVDKIAAAMKEIKRAVWTSCDNEVEGILEMNPELVDKASALIAEQVMIHSVRDRHYKNDASEIEKTFMIIPDTHKFKRFITDVHWQEMVDKYKVVPFGEKLQHHHYKLANVRITPLDLDCPNCKVHSHKWCLSKEQHYLCKSREDFFVLTKDYMVRRKLGFPTQ